jgi:transcriptional regulator GlxA family with amidase domain
MPHRVAVVAWDGVVPFDLATPCEVFGRVRLPDGSPAYAVRVCGVAPRVDAGGFELLTRFGLRELARADSVIVPGVADATREVPAPLLRALRRAAAAGTRIASICSGAFALAAAGLLDGLRATTHWLAAPELARRYPAVQVDANVLYVDNGQILSSAGAAAGLDLCLHLVRRDFGAAVAAEAARISVMPLERAGGQAQFIAHERPPAPAGEPFEALRRWIDANLQRELGLETLARRAAVSPRTLSRRFREQLGTTPAQWVLRARVLRAQQLLETSAEPIERIAAAVGFGSAATLRERFHRQLGTSPQSYRRAFRAT